MSSLLCSSLPCLCFLSGKAAMEVHGSASWSVRPAHCSAVFRLLQKIRDFSVPSAFYLGGRSASLSFFLFYLQWYTAHSASIYVHLVRFMVFSTGFHSTITRLMLPNVRNADFAQRNVIWVSRFMKIQTVRNVSAVENAKMSVQPALSIQGYVPKPEFNLPWSSRFCGAFIGCEGQI